jgi:hypothetical protein
LGAKYPAPPIINEQTNRLQSLKRFALTAKKGLNLQLRQPFNLQNYILFKSGSRKVVLQTRIFFWSTTFLDPEKKSEFAEPFFSNLKKM